MHFDRYVEDTYVMILLCLAANDKYYEISIFKRSEDSFSYYILDWWIGKDCTTIS